MRTRQRMLGLKQYVYDTVCKGRMMKAPAENQDFTVIARQEPQVYIGFEPMKPDLSGFLNGQPSVNVTPGILIMPNVAHGKYVEEKRFDRYSGVHRSKQVGNVLSVSILLSVYEPGIRLPGFRNREGDMDSIDVTRVMEGTEEGLLTLFDWIDDLKEHLLGDKEIPGTDLFLNEETLTYGPYTDQSFIVDKRPIHYGFVNCEFQSYVQEKINTEINDMLN